MASVVYWIHHPEHTDMFTQGYIGVSNDISRRWESHKNRTQNGRLKNAIKSYGWDLLIKKVILVADRWYCFMMEKKLRSADNIGWNHASGGGCPPDLKGNKYRVGITPWNKGVKTSDEVKAKLRLAKLGKPSPRLGAKHSPESIKKMREIHAGKIHSEEARAKISESRTGLKQEVVVCPHCEKAGGKQTMARWHFNNCKMKGAQIGFNY